RLDPLRRLAGLPLLASQLRRATATGLPSLRALLLRPRLRPVDPPLGSHSPGALPAPLLRPLAALRRTLTTVAGLQPALLDGLRTVATALGALAAIRRALAAALRALGARLPGAVRPVGPARRPRLPALLAA